MKLGVWQIDAFAEKVFEGNPAAVVPLDGWLDGALMQRIANENNLAETAASAIRAISGPGAVARFIPEDKGLIVTSKGDEGYDFISRYFAPHHGVAEDPVTGSAHCALTPFWAKRLDRKTLRARQVSPRGGELVCTDDGPSTILSGLCALYMRAEICPSSA
jgi:predicted PhzF superfamily epimerase YddE/YHI9